MWSGRHPSEAKREWFDEYEEPRVSLPSNTDANEILAIQGPYCVLLFHLNRPLAQPRYSGMASKWACDLPAIHVHTDVIRYANGPGEGNATFLSPCGNHLLALTPNHIQVWDISTLTFIDARAFAKETDTLFEVGPQTDSFPHSNEQVVWTSDERRVIGYGSDCGTEEGMWSCDTSERALSIHWHGDGIFRRFGGTAMCLRPTYRSNEDFVRSPESCRHSLFAVILNHAKHIALLDTRTLAVSSIVCDRDLRKFFPIVHPTLDLILCNSQQGVVVFSHAQARDHEPLMWPLGAEQKYEMRAKSMPAKEKEHKQEEKRPLISLFFEKPNTRAAEGGRKRAKTEDDISRHCRQLEMMDVSDDGRKVVAAKGRLVCVWEFLRE